MLQLFSTGILPLWLNTAGVLVHQAIPAFSLLDLLQINSPDIEISKIWQAALSRFSHQGSAVSAQGFWLQTQDRLLVSHNALEPLPAASLTKVATSLAALKTWGPNHTFITDIRATGPVKQGVLQGDLVIVGGGDPLFVGPEAVSIGHSLNRLGIQRVAGNLVIAGVLTIDFLPDPRQAGERLRQGLKGQVYPLAIENSYTPSPRLTPLNPNLEISGGVQWNTYVPQSQLLLRHSSLPLYALLKQMNVNSNNALATALTTQIGGVPTLVARVTAATGVPTREFVLENGSGLGQENRLSPRAVAALLQGIQRELQRHQLTLADVLPVASRDRGTIEERQLPQAAIVKTGTLWNVSALAGVIPTQKFGPVWFTIINRGENIEGFRQDQDRILQQLTQRLGVPSGEMAQIQPSRPTPILGDPNRNQDNSQPR